jgi:hypothetical protein
MANGGELLQSGNLQTLLVTLQQTNQQLGQICKAISGSPLLASVTAPVALTSAPPEPDGVFPITLPDGSIGYVPFYRSRPT